MFSKLCINHSNPKKGVSCNICHCASTPRQKQYALALKWAYFNRLNSNLINPLYESEYPRLELERLSPMILKWDQGILKQQ